MTYAFHPEAEEEFGEAVAYYEQCETGLGLDFAAEVRATIQNILGYQEAGPKGRPDDSPGQRPGYGVETGFEA